MIIYDELVEKAKEAGITSHTIKTSKLMSQSVYTKMKNNDGYVGLESIEKILNATNTERIELVRDGENYKIIIPGAQND